MFTGSGRERKEMKLCSVDLPNINMLSTSLALDGVEKGK